ncbi:MAG: PAS domain-containing protein, partial [Spirochaetales bacterium]|nr:PAS domain-containing protein [Spirochaetales bacterium]
NKEIEIYEHQFRMKHKDDSWVWILDRGKVFEWDKDGKPIRMSGTHLDITERIQAEFKLADSEKRYRSYFESSPFSLWEQDYSDVITYLDGLVNSSNMDIQSLLDKNPEILKKCVDLVKIIDVNPATLRLYNAHCKEDLLWSLSRVFTEESYRTFKVEIICIYNRELIPSRESTNKLLDGRIINVQVESAVLSDNRYIKTITDITDQRNIAKKLATSEERLGLALAGSDLGLWDEWIPTGELYVNNRWAEIIGYTLEEISPVTMKFWRENTHPDDLKEVDGIGLKSPGKKSDIIDHDIRMKHKNGSWVWIRTKGKAVEWADNGKPLRSAGTHLDITERKKTELKLHESEDRFRNYFESSPLSLWEEDYTDIISYIHSLPVSNDIEFKLYLDTNTEVLKKCSKLLKILDVNKTTLKMYEAESKNELITNFDKLFTTGSVFMFKKKLVSIYNKIPNFSHETRHRTLKGREIHIKLDSVLLSDNRSLITISNITEQKYVEQQLIESENKFRSYFENSPLALWEEDYVALKAYMHNLPVSGELELSNYLNLYPNEISRCLKLVNILNMNQAALDLYEAGSKDEMINNFITIFTPESLEAFKDELIALYNGDKSYKGIFSDKTLKGKDIVVKFEMIKLSENKYLTTTTDITELKNKETELENLLAQSKSDSETKEILLREINHRVKNNLSSFIGMLYAEKKQSGNDPDVVQMEHIDSLINRVKGISIAHEMLSRSQWTAISVSKLTEKIIHSLNHLIPKDRVINTKIIPSDIFLDADQSHSIAIIINELFSNSIEHATSPGEKLTVEIEMKEKEGTIILTFKDNGPGYPVEILKSEFKNVGMYLIKNIVEQSLRGVMRVSNKDGTRIEIEFPGGSKLEELY